MPTFNSILKAQLDTAATKLDWAAILKSSLGNARRLRCFRDANAAAVDPFSTGTEFLNLAMTGDLATVNGNITGFGIATGATIKQAADLSTGSSILRIEGNGNWVQYSLGLSGSGKEFTLPSNPTTTAGVAFSNTAQFKAPPFLASGIGPSAPTIKSTTPTIIELEDWTNPSSPVVVGIANLSRRISNWVFENQEMATEIGDVAMYTVDETIKWTTPASTQRFELGALLMVAANYNTEGGTVQLEQMLCSFKPLGRWSTYPFMDTYVRATYPVVDSTTFPVTYGACNNASTADLTYPPPFKIKLYSTDGYKNGASDKTPLFTHEIKAFNDKPTMPINSPLCSQSLTYDEPILPHFNCAMMLPWQNIRTKRSANAGKYFAGVNSYCYSNRAAKSPASSNACIPLVNASAQVNGQNNFYWMPLWPMKRTEIGDTYDPQENGNYISNPYKASHTAYLNAYDTTPDDPDTASYRRSYYPQLFRVTGIKYQPGSISGHDWRTGNGGVRFDRNVIPHTLAIWAGDPNYVRPLGNVPIRDIVEDWGLAYFNHSNHWVRDLKTFESLPKSATNNGDMVFKGGYYGSGPYGALGESRGPQLTIDICGVSAGNQRSGADNDSTGRLPYGGWQRDILHPYSNAAWYSILLNSPMHAIAATHDYHTIWMSALGQSYPTSDPSGNAATDQYSEGFFMVRSHAWRWMVYGLQWQVASSHPLSFSRAEVESRFQTELEAMYDTVYKPAFIDNDQRPYFVGIRNLGIAIKADGFGNFRTAGGSLALYLGPTLMILKQFGLLSVMKAKSNKCKSVIDMTFACLDKMAIDYCLDTDMRDTFYPMIYKGATISAANVPANWGAQKAGLDAAYPVLAPGANTSGATDDQFFKNFTLKYDNSYGEQYGVCHMFYQYLKIRKVYFPEYPHARLDAAISKMDGYYAAHDSALTASTGNWNFLYPNYGEVLPPTALGPI